MTSIINNLGPVISNSSYLVDVLQPCHGLLKVAHINCNSIRPSHRSTKFDEFRHIVNGSGFDIIAVSETWLKCEVSTNAVHIPNYTFCRNDREHCRGGGVGIYVSDAIKFKIVFKSSIFDKCESLFLELS